MKTFALTIFSCILLNAFAQNRASTCYMGNILVDFRTSPLSVSNVGGISGTESAASICDESGNLLFYTNGGNSPTHSGSQGGIWNASNQLMENGSLTDFAGCISSFYGAVIVPFPSNNQKLENDLYYVFTRDCLESSFTSNATNSGLTYSVVDMSFNGGLGKVTEKYQTLVPYSNIGGHRTTHEPLAAIQHANNMDYWLFSYNNDSLYSLKITSEGIGNYRSYDLQEGRIVIAPTKDFLMTQNTLFDFDAHTGDLTFKANINSGYAAFSPDGKLVYVLEGNQLFQYQLHATNFQSSKVLIASGVNVDPVLAPDGKIYFHTNNTSGFSGSIHCPNALGSQCGFSMNPVPLTVGTNGYCFTNVMAHYLYKEGTNCMLETAENEWESKIEIAPNPTQGVLKISVENPDPFHFELISLNGQILEKSQEFSQNCAADFSTYPNGSYLLRIVSGDFVVNRKVILHK